MRIRPRLVSAASLLFFLFFAGSAVAQTTPDWTITPNAPNGVPIGGGFGGAPGLKNPRHVAALDGSGNLFLAGHYAVAVGINPEGYGQFLGKYSAADGSEQWHFTGAVPSALNGVALNAAGDAFVAGYYVSNTIEHHYVARISGASGALMWEMRGIPNEATENYAADIVLDRSGNPIVLGAHNGRAVVTKYDGATGAFLWSVVPGADAPGFQTPFGIEADPDGNIVGVTYYGDVSIGGQFGSLLFKIDGATGARLWATPWAWTVHNAPIPEIQGLTLDGAGKPILVGKGIAKFSNVDGSLNWQRTLSESGGTSFAFAAATDSTGDVFVTGAEDPQLQIVVTAKLRSLDGTTRWHARLQPTSTKANQFGRSITLDANQDPLVAAKVFYDGSSTDYEIQTLLYTNDGVLRLMAPRFNVAAAGGSQGDADLELHFVQHAYTIGHYTRASDGALVTVVLKYTEPRKVFATSTLTASPNPATLSAPVTLSATVSGPVGTPTGTVDFSETTSTVTPIPGCQGVALVNGAASCNAGTLTAGQHRFQFVYPGDATYAASSANVTETVRNNQASVSLAVSPNPSSFEQSVTLIASVSGSVGTPTGTVRFVDGASSIYGCTAVALSSGSASCTLNGLVPGTHSITAAYSGDASYDPATSSAISETVQGSIAAAALQWQATTTDSPQPFLDTSVNAPSVGPRSGVDASGNLYVVATRSRTADNAMCAIVVKYTAGTGATAWRRDLCSSAGTTFGGSLGVDAGGNVLVTGALAGNLLVAKLSGDTGATLWQQAIVGRVGLGLRLDSFGNARVVGWTGGAITVYGIANATGAVQWQTPLDTVLGGKPLSFAVGGDGSVAIYDRHTIDSRDNFADVTTRLDPSGAITWRVTEPGGESALAMDNQGNVIGSSATGLVKRDVVTGTVLWRQSFGGASVADSQGNIYVAANASAPDASIPFAFRTDAFFAKIDSSGHVAWTKLLVDPGNDVFMLAIVVDNDGNPVAIGQRLQSGVFMQQETFKLSAADGQVIWIAQLGSGSVGFDPNNLHAAPQGVLTVGELRGTNGSDQGLYAALYASTGTPQPTGPITLDRQAIDFGAASMGTTSLPRTATVTNTSGGTLSITSVNVTGPFAQANNCGTLAPNAACVVSVTFSPVATTGSLNSSVAASGTLTVNAGPGASASATLSGVAEKSLVTHYYEAILRREPDAGGHDFWQGEAARMASLGANVNEAWYAMSIAFFASPEYAAFRRDNAGYLTDLYQTFFNRAPDAGGFGFWMDQMAAGMPRETVVLQFLFSPEFASFTQSIFGNTAARAEIDMTMDFYRGVLARLPDASGFSYYVGQFRSAQCSGAAAVRATADQVSQTFLYSAEYSNRNRSNAQYVSDLYNALLRRGGDRDSLLYWIGLLDSGAQTREQLRQQFLQSPEFSNRVNNIVAAGCVQ